MRLCVALWPSQGVRPRGTCINPVAEHLNFRLGEPSHVALFRRHHDLFVFPADIVNQRAGFSVVRNNGCLAGVATFQGVIAYVQSIAAFLFLGPVATKTTPLENGPHVTGKIRRTTNSTDGQHQWKKKEDNSHDRRLLDEMPASIINPAIGTALEKSQLFMTTAGKNLIETITARGRGRRLSLLVKIKGFRSAPSR